MPRIAGQIDRAKNEAILDAASCLLTERGLGASVDQISRRAGVSKQTIYNHYGSKEELMRALVARRGESLAAPFDLPDAEANPETTLAAYARSVLEVLNCEAAVAILRLLVGRAADSPEEYGDEVMATVGSARERVAAYLERETQAGLLAVDHYEQAAAFFLGMVVGNYRLMALIGLPLNLDAEAIESRAAAAARRFVRAYAV
jgi:AcrR family transcriptional regulator